MHCWFSCWLLSNFSCVVAVAGGGGADGGGSVPLVKFLYFFGASRAEGAAATEETSCQG